MPRTRSNFGLVFDEVLRRRNLRQGDVAERMDVSAAYVSSLTTGKKKASPERIDVMSESLSLTSEETRRLHRAAALDAGFRLDLPDDY